MREQNTRQVDCSQLSDLVFEGVDFIKIEMEKIKNRDAADGEAKDLIHNIQEFLTYLKGLNPSANSQNAREDKGTERYYISQSKEASLTSSGGKNSFKAVVFFEEGCEMENIRAYAIIHNLKDVAGEVRCIPEDIIENDNSVEIIRKEGFTVYLKTNCDYDEINTLFLQTVFLKNLKLTQLEEKDDPQLLQFPDSLVLEDAPPKPFESKDTGSKIAKEVPASQQSIISVHVDKLDKLMNMVGELVISEAMVTQNPELKQLTQNKFHKAFRQLRKITGEIQDMVMSIRMVPLANTFHKMNRIVRDMSKKLDKQVQLQIIGESTEVDKNIIEHISDPLMHLVRNAIDHGLENPVEREAKGKSPVGTVILEAKNAGSDVLVVIKDDGRGLNKEKILAKGIENGLVHKPAGEMTDREIYSLIFLPGFSTNEAISEFSGRGVGMDVVARNIETVGGTISVDSIPDKGATITLKIPLTLAIINGMNIRVGESRYTLPTISVKESFKPKESEIIKDPDGNEMIMVRGQCYPILRLHQRYGVKTRVTHIQDGILIMVDHESGNLCIFADELLGEQQVVVKALPNYIKNRKRIRGLAGCTLLGDGSISLILDIQGLFAL